MEPAGGRQRPGSGDPALEGLEFTWGAAWMFRRDAAGFHARRRDGLGGEVSALDPGDLGAKLAAENAPACDPDPLAVMAAEITMLCPGWVARHDGRAWLASRAGGFLACDGSGTPCVTAATVPGLIAAIDQAAARDLAGDFPGWAVTRRPLGGWLAAREGAVVGAMTAAGLHAALSARHANARAGAGS